MASKPSERKLFISHWGKPRWVYKLRLTKTEHDQLVAALGGEDA